MYTYFYIEIFIHIYIGMYVTLKIHWKTWHVHEMPSEIPANKLRSRIACHQVLSSIYIYRYIGIYEYKCIYHHKLDHSREINAK